MLFVISDHPKSVVDTVVNVINVLLELNVIFWMPLSGLMLTDVLLVSQLLVVLAFSLGLRFGYLCLSQTVVHFYFACSIIIFYNSYWIWFICVMEIDGCVRVGDCSHHFTFGLLI